MNSLHSSPSAAGSADQPSPEYSMAPELAASLRRPVRAELTDAQVQAAKAELARLWPAVQKGMK